MTWTDEPIVTVVTGVMAAGKSTVADLLAARFDKTAIVPGDVFRKMIVRGASPVLPDFPGDALGELELRYALSAKVADGYAAAGFSVVWQDIILGPHLGRLPALVSHRPLAIVVLAPRADVVREREASRPKKGYVDGWTVEGLDHILRRETPRIGLWIDSSDLTPEATVAAIFGRGLEEALVEG